MKKNEKNNQQALMLPTEVQTLCGFEAAETLAIKAAEGICLIHKGGLTVLEVAQIITALTEIASDLTVHLAKVAGLCDGCGDCGSGDDFDPAECAAHCTLCHDLFDERQRIHLPDHLLEEADIPVGAKLEAFVDEDSGDIIVTESDIQQDISDLPEGVVAVLAAGGVCLAELDERIVLGDIVYGE